MSNLEVAALIYVIAYEEFTNYEATFTDPIKVLLENYKNRAHARLCDEAHKFEEELEGRKEV